MPNSGTTTGPKQAVEIAGVADGVEIPISGGGGGAVTVADGADIVQGGTTDAAIITSIAGTISGKVRGIIAILADIWNSTNNFLRVLSLDIMLAIPAEWLTGYYAVNKYGRSTNVDSGVLTDIWDKAIAGGTNQPVWLAPTAARIHTIASDNAADTTGSTGANSVIIFYLADWDTKETTETVTGNLNAGIAMGNAAVMINRMRVIPQATSTTPNVGTITATAAIDGTVTSQINPSEGQTQQAIYGFPSTQTVYMTGFYASVLRANLSTNEQHIDACIMFNPSPDINSIVFITKNTIGMGTRGNSPFRLRYWPYNKFDGPGIIKRAAIGSANNLDVSSGFDLILIDN